jgi:hypothetical protein
MNYEKFTQHPNGRIYLPPHQQSAATQAKLALISRGKRTKNYTSPRRIKRFDTVTHVRLLQEETKMCCWEGVKQQE